MLRQQSSWLGQGRQWAGWRHLVVENLGDFAATTLPHRRKSARSPLQPMLPVWERKCSRALATLHGRFCSATPPHCRSFCSAGICLELRNQVYSNLAETRHSCSGVPRGPHCQFESVPFLSWRVSEVPPLERAGRKASANPASRGINSP
mgnify:CR=1 FL=1